MIDWLADTAGQTGAIALGALAIAIALFAIGTVTGKIQDWHTRRSLR